MSIRAYDDVDDVERKRIEDYLVAVSKLAVSTIPIAGPALSEILGFFLGSPVEVRRIEFLRDLDEKITGLIESGVVTIDSLKQNEDFMNVVINAIPMALKAFEDEKRTAFRNAILNSAQHVNPDQTKTQIFLRCLETMTLAHIQLLVFIRDPKSWYKQSGTQPNPGKIYSSLSSLIGDTFPALKTEDHLVDILWQDLKSYGFHELGGVKIGVSEDGLFNSRTTALGNEFVDFISFEEPPF